MKNELTPDQIIAALGGTTEAARFVNVSAAAISQWRKNGVPKNQLRWLKIERPEIFCAIQSTEKAT